jgi:putative methionine-R-sulfoxide reductase with GAF domain
MSDQENRSTALESVRLYEIGHTLVSTLNLDETLDQVLQSLEEIVGPHAFIIFLVDEPQDELYARSQRGYPAEATRALRIKIGQEGITGWVAQIGQPLYVPDVTRTSTHPVTTNYGSEMAAPLRVREKVIGVLDVASHWPHAFSTDDLRALSALPVCCGGHRKRTAV